MSTVLLLLAAAVTGKAMPVSADALGSPNYAVIPVTIILVTAAVLVHDEVLKLLTRGLAKMKGPHRRRILVLIFGLMLAHFAEIVIFSFGYWWANDRPGCGYLRGDHDSGLLDCIYFSFTTYATVGYGDLVPVGMIRFLAAFEALAGIVMVGWSVSFTFLEMQRYWGKT